MKGSEQYECKCGWSGYFPGEKRVERPDGRGYFVTQLVPICVRCGEVVKIKED